MTDVDNHDADTLPAGSDANDSNNTAPNNPTTAEPNASEPTTFEVSGEQVSLDDLKAGYLRQADYTRKTQKLAEDQKKYEAMLENLKGQSSNTAGAPTPSQEASPTVPANLEEALVRFTKWEQSQKAADRVAEWDSFKSSNGLELTDDEEAAFVQELAERDSRGEKINIQEAAALRFMGKLNEAAAKRMIAEHLERSKDKTKTVGPGNGGRTPSAESGASFDDLVNMLTGK
jgi:hypothetical protein